MFEKLGSKTGFLILALWLGLQAATASASETVLPQHSPFDKKLAATGFYDWKTDGQAGEHRSIEELFAVARSFRYARELKTDRWQTPQETEARRSGDCEDKAVWLYWVLKTNGYQNVALHIGRYRSVDARLHVWVTVEDGSNEWMLDPTT